MENTSLKVLCLEDSPRDAEIIRELLTDAGYDLHLDWTALEKEYESLLRSRKYDIIVSDFRLPGFDAFGALRLSIDICPDVPFICVSGSIGEEIAIDLLKEGAVDYVLKDRMARLPLAIKRARDEAKEVESRRRAEEALRKSERRFQTLAEMSPVGIFQTDAEGSTTYVNPRWCKISGLSGEEAMGTGWLGAVHIEDREELSTGWKKATQVHDSSVAEYRFVRKDGTTTWVMGQAIPEIDIEERIVGYFGTITDITERKLMEEALREREREISLIYDTVGDILFYLKVEKDGSYCFASVNQCFLTTTGLQADQILGKRVHEIIPEPSLTLVLAKYAEAIREKKIVRWEETSEYPTGRLIGEVGIAPVFDERMNCIGLVGSVHDITERKRGEEVLRESEEKLRRIFENMQDVYYEVNLDGTIVEISPSIETMSNGQYCRSDLLGKSMYDFYSDPGERQTLLERLQHQGAVTDFEITLRNRDGSSIPCSISSKILLDPEQKPVKILGSLRDITERKRADEKTLRQLDELQRWHQVMLGREDRIRHLKCEVNDLLMRSGEAIRYPSQETSRSDDHQDIHR